MSMTALSAFRPWVAGQAPTATDPMIDRCVLDACIEFCDRTLVVKRMLTPISTVADVAGYALAAPAGESVAHVMRLWADGAELVPLDEDGLAGPQGFVASVPGVTSDRAGMPRYFNETDPGSISLYPRPDAVYTLNVRAALRPLRTATSVDSQLFEDWVEAITSGALARLFAVPGDLLNPVLAKYHAGNFQQFVDRAQLQASRGRTRATLSITPVHI